MNLDDWGCQTSLGVHAAMAREQGLIGVHMGQAVWGEPGGQRCQVANRHSSQGGKRQAKDDARKRDGSGTVRK